MKIRLFNLGNITNKRRFVQFLSVIIILVLIPIVSSAAASKKKIDVIYQGIKLVVDDIEKKTSPEPIYLRWYDLCPCKINC